MIGGIFLIVITAIVSFVIVDYLKKKYRFIDADFLKRLFFYHLLLAFAYYGYIFFNPSDSRAYYYWVVTEYHGENWIDYYGTSTIFVQFLGYPFIKYFQFSYEAMMVLFSFFGYLGFIYFYIFFKENIRFNHRFLGIDLLSLILFLPNLHFWSASLGKGSIIFFGIGLFFYGLSNIRKRILPLLIGGIIIYHVRPHIMLVILVSSAIGFIFTTKGISLAFRLLFLAGAFAVLFFIYQDVLDLVGLDEEEFISQGLDLTHRATELSKATSGVNITSYNLPLQIFTFLYRPLFFDAPGVLGLIVSVENVLYLLLTMKLFSNLNGFRFLLTGNFLVKSTFLSFITVSTALAQVSGNLGLAIRQKSQVMILFMFVIMAFLDEKKIKALKDHIQRKKRLDRVTSRKVVSQ